MLTFLQHPQFLQRLQPAADLGDLVDEREHDADDIIRECYGSQEFREGVTAFLEGRKPNWY